MFTDLLSNMNCNACKHLLVKSVNKTLLKSVPQNQLCHYWLLASVVQHKEDLVCLQYLVEFLLLNIVGWTQQVLSDVGYMHIIKIWDTMTLVNKDPKNAYAFIRLNTLWDYYFIACPIIFIHTCLYVLLCSIQPCIFLSLSSTDSVTYFDA